MRHVSFLQRDIDTLPRLKLVGFWGQAEINKSQQEPFTTMPNRYMDRIAPQLTDTQHAICDVVIRMTYGWHRTSAMIPNAVFVRKSKKSERAISKAKKQLEDMGLLIVLQKGGGSRTGVYMLDLYYDDPEKSIKASILCQEEQLQEMKDASSLDAATTEDQENSPGLLETSSTDAATTPEEEQPETDISITESEPSEEVKETSSYQEHAPESTEVSDIGQSGMLGAEVQLSESETLPEEDRNRIRAYSDSVFATRRTEIPDAAEVENPGGIEVPDPSTPEPNSTPHIEDQSIDLNIKEKHTMVTVTEEAKKSRKKAIAAVRFNFTSLFPESKAEDDWAFFGWVIKAYSLEACLEKLNYMKEHRKRHTITNPKGFFRFALEKDYRPPAFIAAKIRADEKARRAIERSRKKNGEWGSMIENFNYEKAAASLQKLLNTLN